VKIFVWILEMPILGAIVLYILKKDNLINKVRIHLSPSLKTVSVAPLNSSIDQTSFLPTLPSYELKVWLKFHHDAACRLPLPVKCERGSRQQPSS
jgi:hypothetical protein